MLIRLWGKQVRRQVAVFNGLAGGHDGGALNAVLQFADVARPVVFGHGLQGVGAKAGDAFTGRRAQAVGEVAGQRGNVFHTLAQGGQRDREHIQAVVQVFAKLFIGHGLQQIFVGGRNDPHVDLALAGISHRLDDSLLQRAQNLGLQRQRHVTDLIEKQRAFVGL